MSREKDLAHYANTLFVNREAEIEAVRQKLEQLMEGQTLDKRTTIFTGEHGMGKSWLLRHLQAYLSSADVATHYVNLERYFTQPDLEQATQQLCADIWQALFQNAMPTPTSLEQAARLLIIAVKERLLAQRALVLLIDTVYEAPPAFLAALEDYLLSVFAIEPKVLLVLAGRGREYVFRSPELRLRADFITLLPFTPAVTQAQLQCQVPSKVATAAQIYAITLGNPKANGLLAIADYSPTVLNSLIDEMLRPIQSDQRVLIRTYLEAVAVPRRFDYSHVPHLLAAYHVDESYKTWPRRRMRDIFDELLDPGLIYWNTAELAYTIHASTRNLLLQYLKAAQVERWHRLQHACVELYRSWVAGRPRNWEHWQVELDHHEDELRSVE